MNIWQCFLVILCAICSLLLLLAYFKYLRDQHIKQLLLFIEQAAKIETANDYQAWVNEVKLYINRHFNYSYQIRFNQIRQLRFIENASAQTRLTYTLDGRLLRLAEFVIELKRSKFTMMNW